MLIHTLLRIILNSCVPPSYENKDKTYSPIKMLRAWTELQRYKSGTYLSHMLWEAYDHFLMLVASGDFDDPVNCFIKWNTTKYDSEYIFTDLDNINYYNTYVYKDKFNYKDHPQYNLYIINKSFSTSLSELFHIARKHWKDYPDSKESLFKIISQVIDLDKQYFSVRR